MKARACTVRELKKLLDKFDDDNLVFFDVLGVDERSSAVIDSNTLHDTVLPIEDYGHSVWVKLREYGMYYEDTEKFSQEDDTDSVVHSFESPHFEGFTFGRGKGKADTELTLEFDDEVIPF